MQSPNHCAAREFPGPLFLFCPCCIFPTDLDCFQFLHVQETTRCFESWQGFDHSSPPLETLLRPFACWECNCCAERCLWLSDTTLFHVIPLSSCTDVEYHAGLIVIRGVFLCLPSFEVDIFSLSLFFFGGGGCFCSPGLSVFMEIFEEIQKLCSFYHGLSRMFLVFSQS